MAIPMRPRAPLTRLRGATSLRDRDSESANGGTRGPRYRQLPSRLFIPPGRHRELDASYLPSPGAARPPAVGADVFTALVFGVKVSPWYGANPLPAPSAPRS